MGKVLVSAQVEQQAVGILRETAASQGRSMSSLINAVLCAEALGGGLPGTDAPVDHSEEYRIDQSVPAPKSPPPFAQMGVGDSIFIKGDFRDVNECKEAVYSGVYGLRHGMKFKRRRTDEGVRIWRVE